MHAARRLPSLASAFTEHASWEHNVLEGADANTDPLPFFVHEPSIYA